MSNISPLKKNIADRKCAVEINKERGEQGGVPVYGLQQDVEHECQRGVAQSLLAGTRRSRNRNSHS